MQVFSSLTQLFEKIETLSNGEWVYTNLEMWNTNPENCSFYYITDDYINDLEDNEIYLDDNDLEMPISVQNLNLNNFMTVGDISHIYHKNNQDIAEAIKEINHYRRFDDFIS